MEEEKCEICKFYFWKQCRRFPPSASHGFPFVKEDESCGEFKIEEEEGEKLIDAITRA